jgi:uncharacterized protein (UPF0332 family)
VSIDGYDWLNLARELASWPTAGATPRQEEARLRAAISRAYYATFWEAQAQLLTEGERIPRLDAHHVVIDAFQRSPQRARQTIGHHLNKLRADRNEADYQRNIGDLANLRLKTQRLLDRAATVLAALNRLDT